MVAVGKRVIGRGQTQSDTYAIFDVRREHDLSPHECWVLLALERMVDVQTCRWTGALVELANDYLGMGTRTLVAALDRLVEAGLVEVVRPFTRGRRGVLRLVAWDRLHWPSSDSAGSVL